MRRLSAGMALGLLAAVTLAPRTACSDEEGAFTFLWENDAIAGTDHRYTNGLEFSYLSKENALSGGARTGSTVLPGVADKDVLRFGVSIGQQIYTPDDTDVEEPLPDQRPYAGWLYLGLAVIAEHDNKRLDTWVLNVGVVGPSARGEEVQNGFHDDVSNDDAAEGWDNQLEDTFGYQLLYEHRIRNIIGDEDVKELGSLQLDVSPHIGLSLGNIGTYANGGITVRFGKGLEGDYGVPRIRPSLPGSSFFEPQAGFGWYVFAGVDARLVAYNIFLEGDSPTYDVNLDKETFVYDGQAGLAVVWRTFRFAYTYVIRSREYEGQDVPDRFGSVGMTWRF